MKTGGQLIVEALEANGVERVSLVPGESFLACSMHWQTARSSRSSAARKAALR